MSEEEKKALKRRKEVIEEALKRWLKRTVCQIADRSIWKRLCVEV